ncbi:unnamed protein product [marine sediment metagenome]|uniref:Uncharacterized protein n=1 Tax=marine sediment metagenome TaxID=412755 RepID=X1APN7_9ZZZZ
MGVNISTSNVGQASRLSYANVGVRFIEPVRNRGGTSIEKKFIKILAGLE